MRIDGSTKATRTMRTSSAKGSSSAASGAFALSNAHPSTGSASQLVGTTPLSSLTNLLSIQADDDDIVRRRLAKKRGDDLLLHLDELRLALLEGRLAAETLVNLRATLSVDREQTDDPRLDAVLAEIELRAEVEFAKLDQVRRR